MHTRKNGFSRSCDGRPKESLRSATSLTRPGLLKILVAIGNIDAMTTQHIVKIIAQAARRQGGDDLLKFAHNPGLTAIEKGQARFKPVLRGDFFKEIAGIFGGFSAQLLNPPAQHAATPGFVMIDCIDQAARCAVPMILVEQTRSFRTGAFSFKQTVQKSDTSVGS